MSRLRRRLARIGAPVRVCLSACVYEPDPKRRRLRQMLDSTVAAGTTDYAIAVDRKSTPGTVAWVRWYLFRRRGVVASVLRPARVVEFEWQDDFAHARNVALDLVPPECDWLYAIDSDDVLEPQEGRSLPEVLAELPSTCRALRIPYLVPNRHGDSETESMYETFFRGPVTFRWKRAWGETLQPIDRSGGGSLCSSAFVRRHDRDWSINRQRGANGRNHRIIRAALDADPADHSLWAFWGQCRMDSLDWTGAADSWERALPLCSTDRQRVGIVCHLVPVLTITDRLDRARELGRLACEWYPERPEPYFCHGRALLMSGDFLGAIQAVEEGLRHLPAVAKLEDRSLHPSLPSIPHFYDCEPHYLLAESYGQLGEFEVALREVDAALTARPRKLWDLYLHQLRELFRAHERPPFMGERLQRVFVATSEAIKRITSYEAEEDVVADLDELMPYLTAEGVDLGFVLERVEYYFGERPAFSETAA